ncbi:MAG: DNA-binding protein [Opitutales bacterium]|nr:DNA-binding protein [Opitutales bacterium]
MARDWTVVDSNLRLSPRVFQELLDGGQSFSWDAVGERAYAGVAGGHAWQIRLSDSGQIEAHSPTGGEALWIQRYFGAEKDFAALTDALPWRSDPVLRSAFAAFPGLRILRQEAGETLLGFICSSTKQIVQIKDILRRLARRFGRPLADGFHAVPTWADLAAINEGDLREEKMGYRARFICETAEILAGAPDYLDGLADLPFTEAKARLLALPGVGEKIADCVLLFGAGRLEAFPVDTWIAKILREAYRLPDWSTDALRRFGEIHFGEAAGLAQQFLFAYARAEAGAGKAVSG